MTYQGRDVWQMLQAKSHPAFNSGVSISASTLKTEMEVARQHGGWPVYAKLDTDTRAALVVDVMLDKALEALKSYDQHEKQKREAKRAAKNRQTGSRKGRKR